jgi:hypothetical protein
MTFRTRHLWGLALTASLVVAACGESGEGPDTTIAEPGSIQQTPEVGQSDFVSADGQNGEGTQDNASNNAAPEAGAEADAAGDDARTVEEGDIFRVASNGSHIYNLNAYRGFQVLDFADPTKPDIIGNARLAGHPVEMYQVDDKVYALMNNWRGYYGSRSDLVPTAYEGGVVVTIDIADPTKPEVVDHDQVPGYIRTSRLTRGNGQEALFVAAADYDGTTYVKSFTVGGAGVLAPASEIQLSGNVSDIQATPERLIVARWDWRSQNQGSQISLIDITDPTGQMVEGDTVRAKGRVANKFNMDVYNDVLRVVSGNSWDSTTNTNWVQTWDASDISSLRFLHEDSFGDNEDLYATIFLGNSAFFVTYRRVDPFHAYEVLDDGRVTEKSEFIVSGWNDYFRPVENQTRLVGIGKNDQNGNTMAVSLYDITDLSNPNPLIDRKEVDLDWSWSEASWDDRAFSVLEKATVAQADDGTIETGVVLLPFSGYDDQADKYVSAVQIFTFSDTTITRRGIMDHGTRVRRSFVADAANNTTGNLSEEELSLFDTYDTDNPVELGRVELAPNFTEIFTFGSHAVRRQNRNGWYYWWGYNDSSMRKDHLEVVATSGDIDRIDALHTIEIPASAVVEKVGTNKLMVAYSDVIDANNQTYETTLELYDLTMPTTPQKVDTLTSTDLPPVFGNGYYYGYWGDCWDCGWGYYNSANIQVVGDAIVFVEPQREQELEGTVRRRYQYVDRNWYEACYDPNTGDQRDTCTWISGGISCRQLTRVDGTRESEVCYGSFQQCTRADGDTTCTEVTPDPSTVRESTNTYESYRYWTHYDLHVVDASGNTLAAAPSLDMARNEEASGLLARGDSLYVSFKKPFRVPGDSRPFVRYFFRELDFSTPSMAQVGPDVNVPGELVEVDGDTVITRDFLWGSQIIESSLNRLKVQNGRATLTAPPQRLVDQQIYQIQLDGAGHVLVTHRAAWRVQSSHDELMKLTMFDLDAATFDRLDTFEVDRWATLRDAIGGRALFSVPGGLLVVNTTNPSSPFAQAYFPVNGWPRAFVLDGRDVYMASGRYGIYTFGFDSFNLLTNTTSP